MDDFRKALYLHTGERLRRARMMRGMSQIELAAAVGYSDSTTIYKIEKGLQKIPGSKIQRFCSVLGIDADYLTTGFDYEPVVKAEIIDSPIDYQRDKLITEAKLYLYEATIPELQKIVEITKIIVGGEMDGNADLE